MLAHVPHPSIEYEQQYVLPIRAQLFQAASRYLNTEELNLLEKACAYATISHGEQTRKSGEPYITHPIAVTIQLAEWRMDIETLCAGLMHDVLEDTPTTKADMEQTFGHAITEMVDGLSKLEKLEFTDKGEHQAASFRKLILAMTKDVRTIVVKLSDRLHNMKTLDGVAKISKRQSTSRETLEIYAPIANRLGLNNVCRQLQDLSFQYLYPKRYSALRHAMDNFPEEYVGVIDKVIHNIQNGLKEVGIEAQVLGRERNLYTIYQKMVTRHAQFKDIRDVYSFSVILDSDNVVECYTVLGVLHQLYAPKLGKIKDFIAIPKSNGYQSLHTTLIGPYNLPIKVQIRTKSMHALARYGIVAHVQHKEDSPDATTIRTNQWLKNILDLQSSSENAKEFFEHIKTDLFSNDVYVFSPQGRLFTLPRGSTPIDFAYAVHTDIGNRCVGAQVNGVAVPLRTRLRNNDNVNIITSDQARPNSAWLNFAKTSRARSAIRNYMKNVSRPQAIEQGRSLLSKALTGLLPQEVVQSSSLLDFYQTYLTEKGTTFDEIAFQVGLGEMQPISVALEIAELAEKHFNDEIKLNPIKVNQQDAGRIRLADCCHPIAGDAVRAALDKERGLVIHRESCGVLLKIPLEQQFDADWDKLNKHSETLYDVVLNVVSQDAHALLAAMSKAISDGGGNIAAVDTVSKSQATAGTEGFIEFAFTLNVKDSDQLTHIADNLKQIPHVRTVTRM